MKKFKLLFILALCFVFSGCTSEYNLEIVDNNVYEETLIYNSDSSLWDKPLSSGEENTDEVNNTIYTYRQSIDENLKNKSNAFTNDNTKFYKKSKISKKNKLGIRHYYNYELSNYNNSYIANNCFKYFNVLSTEDTYVISTSNGFSCFNYKNLDNVIIHLKTNHKVKDNNANEVDGYNYYWNINENNADDSSIYIEFYKDKYVFNYEGKVTKILIIGIGLAFLIFLVIIFLRKKSNKNNRI